MYNFYEASCSMVRNLYSYVTMDTNSMVTTYIPEYCVNHFTTYFKQKIPHETFMFIYYLA